MPTEGPRAEQEVGTAYLIVASLVLRLQAGTRRHYPRQHPPARLVCSLVNSAPI